MSEEMTKQEKARMHNKKWRESKKGQAWNYQYRQTTLARVREYMAEYRKEKRRKIREYQRAWKAACAAKSPEGYQQKVAVRQAVKRAITTGQLKKEGCIVCKKEPAQAHHEDYNNPLDVMWLCHRHHAAWHRVFYVEKEIK